MGRKPGLTRQEKAIADEYARVPRVTYVAEKLGLHQPSVSRTIARPIVQAEIARRTQELLFHEILPLAVDAHKRLLTDPRTPAGAVVSAVKLAYERTLGSEEGAKQKEPHEMTPEELAQAIATLERAAAAQAKPVDGEARVIEPAAPAPADVFE